MLKAVRAILMGYGMTIGVGLVLAAALLMFRPGMITAIFATDRFEPHGYCFLWEPGLVWLYVLSDLSIGMSYVAISFMLAYLVHKSRRDIPFHRVFLAFGAFIIACGGTHFMDVLTLWVPVYWVSGIVKFFTAIASVATAIVLPPLLPRTLALVRSAKVSEDRKRQLEGTNAELEVLYAKSLELDRLRTQFFANISHELRTPLALILGPIAKLRRAGTLTPEQRHDADVVERNARTLFKHVNDLLDIAKLEAGKLALAYSQVDLSQLVRVVAAHFDTLAYEKDINFQVETPPVVVAQVDADKLQRVFLNLLANAFKFTPNGGSITCTLRQTLTRAIITVDDSGPGVPADLRDAIFERFRQGDGGTTREFGGTGLGLSIVKEFVELHGGNVTVAEVPGGGARFSVELPLVATTNSVESPRTIQTDAVPDADVVPVIAHQITGELRPIADSSLATADDRGLPHVLIVEDNPDMRRFIVETLSGEYRASSANDGVAGLELALREPPDLILTDVMMPRMSGDELLRAVRADAALKDVPVMLLTARASDEARVQLLRAGAQDYLVKPFFAEELRVRVGNLIAMQRTRVLLQQTLASQSEDIAGLAGDVARRQQELEQALTALREAEAALRFLAAASIELAASLDYDDQLQRLARLVVARLADWCVVTLRSEDGSAPRGAFAHRDSSKESFARDVQPWLLFADAWNNQPHNRAVTVINERAVFEALAGAQRSSLQQMLDTLGFRAALIVPLVAHERVLGTIIGVAAESAHPYTDTEQTLAEDLARRAALALENARLYHESQSAIHMRDVFLSIASHELKTPLTALIGYTELLQRRAARDQTMNERDQRAFTAIIDQANRLQRLINELLDLSRLQLDQLAIERQPLELGNLIQRITSAVDVSLERHTLVARIPDEPVRIDGDELRLEQVFHNVLQNAIKYSPDGGQITVEVVPDTHYAHVAITDEGIGIPAAALPHLFRRFYRAPNVDPRQISGFGIGLYVVKEIVERHGGTVAVESTEGRGTRVIVRFPRLTGASTTTQQSAPDSSADTL